MVAETIVGGALAIAGGGVVAWANATARKKHWEREKADKEREMGAAAAADAELALQRANPGVIAMWGAVEQVQSRIDDLQAHMRTAHASLTRLRLSHSWPAVRDAAAQTRDKVVVACNDTAAFAVSVRRSEGAWISLEEAEASRADAEAALQQLVEALDHGEPAAG